MKKRLVILILTIFLCSCTADNSEKRLFCNALGFDLDGNELTVTLSLMSAGSQSPDGEESYDIKSFDNAEKAIDSLLARGNILYKPTEKIFFGKTVDKKTKKELFSLMVNHSEFQLKCDVFDTAVAKDTVMQKEESNNGGTAFSQYYRELFSER